MLSFAAFLKRTLILLTLRKKTYLVNTEEHDFEALTAAH